MTKYKFVDEDENNYLTFADLKGGDIFYIVSDGETTEKNLWMKIFYNSCEYAIDFMVGGACKIDYVHIRVKKYTGTLVFDEKDWTDKK